MSVVDRLPVSVPSAPTPNLPFAPGAFKNAGLLVLAAIPATLVLPFLGIPLLLGAVFVLFFYRDPERDPPSSGYLAPADGTISVVEWDEDEPDRVRIGTYLSPTDVHVVRSPVGAQVQGVRHEPGGHVPAFTKRSERNEKLHVEFDGTKTTMIAGAVARRITAYVDRGQEVRRGDRIGHIAFGSRTDVLLPKGVGPEDLAVEPGESVKAGETVLVPADAIDRKPAPEGQSSDAAAASAVAPGTTTGETTSTDPGDGTESTGTDRDDPGSDEEGEE